MKTYKIEVDEEVYRFLQSRAEAFIDTENSVLRRLLLGKPPSVAGESKLRFPDIPRGILDGLRHTLEVAYLLRTGQVSSRTEATRKVAEKHDVRYPTIEAKYATQLHISAYDFDKMLGEPELNTLKVTLKKKFTKDALFIDEFFEELLKV